METVPEALGLSALLRGGPFAATLHRVIVGIGVDVASIQRMERVLERHGERLWNRVLTEGERADLAARVDRGTALAGRFAAKEALSKALGAPPDVWWQDVEIRSEPNGAPRLVLRGRAAECAAGLGVRRHWVSISHDAGVATAMVILEA